MKSDKTSGKQILVEIPSKFLRTVLDLVFPPRCVFCHRIVESADFLLCPMCGRNTLPLVGPGEEKHGDCFETCVFPLYYEGDVRESLHRFKFKDCGFYADTYAPLLADCIRERLDGRYDLLSWVPLSKKRLLERGYDQSLLLAQAAGRLLGLVPVRTLEKYRNVKKQSLMGGAAERRANISGAYRVPSPETVAGKRVLLVDDIVTTGSTLTECARTLKAAGAGSIVCAALAGVR